MQRLTKWGNSVGLRLPASMLEGAGLKAGAYVRVRLLDSGALLVTPSGPSQPVDQDGTETTTSPRPVVPQTW